MRIPDQPAFVLHRRQYSESSLLIEAFTPDLGRVGLIARGARGSKSALPALLQPFQELRLDLFGSGDLLRLTRAEAAAPALPLRSERTLAGLYCNELMVRLVPRADAHPQLYARYRGALVELVETPALAWALRCFERDLMGELGYANDFCNDADGNALDANGRYRFQPEHGFVAVADDRAGYSGGALLAMAGSSEPLPEQLRELRRLFRELISQQLRGEPRDQRFPPPAELLQRGGIVEQRHFDTRRIRSCVGGRAGYRFAVSCQPLKQTPGIHRLAQLRHALG